MKGSQVPTFATLVDWVEGRLPAERAAEVADLVETQPGLSESVEWIRHFIHLGNDMPLVAPPPEASDRIRAAFRRRTAPWNPAAYDDADLIFDSQTLPRASGLRRAPSGDVVHLVFTSTRARLDLDVSHHADGDFAMHGAVAWSNGRTDETDETLEIILTSDRQIKHVATCDTAGTFHLTGISTDVDEAWVSRGHESLRASIPAGTLSR